MIFELTNQKPENLTVEKITVHPITNHELGKLNGSPTRCDLGPAIVKAFIATLLRRYHHAWYSLLVHCTQAGESKTRLITLFKICGFYEYFKFKNVCFLLVLAIWTLSDEQLIEAFLCCFNMQRVLELGRYVCTLVATDFYNWSNEREYVEQNRTKLSQ